MAEVAAPREIETKYAVERSFTVPPLAAAVPGIAAVDEPRTVELTASYYDTADLRLARDGITLRRRTGGDDAGWHLKLPDPKDADVRFEIGAPLGVAETGQDLAVPESLADLVAVHLRGELLRSVGEVRTTRAVRVLRSDAGDPVAELMDDEVRAETTYGTVVQGTSFRELELELGAGTDRRLDRVDHAGPARDLVEADVRAHVRAIMAYDPLVRRDEPDSVHKMRVSVRRLRSTLRTFGPLLDPAVLELLEGELTWLADVLGEPRDREVMLDRLRGELAALPVEQALGPVSARFDAELYGGLLRAREAALTALRGERYRALVDSLVSFAAQVPTTAAAAEPADAVLRALVRRSWRSLARRVQAAVAADPQHDELYHRARKAAKRTRYAAEACIPAYGSAAADLATRAAAVQDALGEHQDSVIAREVLRTLAVHAHAANENAYTYGLLAGRERCAARTSLTEFTSVWRLSLIHISEP